MLYLVNSLLLGLDQLALLCYCKLKVIAVLIFDKSFRLCLLLNESALSLFACKLVKSSPLLRPLPLHLTLQLPDAALQVLPQILHKLRLGPVLTELLFRCLKSVGKREYLLVCLLYSTLGIIKL